MPSLKKSGWYIIFKGITLRENKESVNRLFYIACAGLPFQISIKKSVINDIFDTFIDVTSDCKSYVVVVVVVVVLLRKSVVQNL